MTSTRRKICRLERPWRSIIKVDLFLLDEERAIFASDTDSSPRHASIFFMSMVRAVFFVGSTCQAMVPGFRRLAPRRMASTSDDMMQEELKTLQAMLSRHDDAYYNVKDESVIIPDAEYDALRIREEELQQRLGEKDRREVGAKRNGAFAAASPHRPKMLSLGNLRRKKQESEVDAIETWLIKAGKASKGRPLKGIVAEPKLDGLSVSLRYVNGALSQGATRGDGIQGDDVTENLLGVEGVRKEIAGGAEGVFEVRGEVMMRRSTFARLREELSFTSARNAAAGSLRQINASVTKERGLCFVAHDLVGDTVDDKEYSEKRRVLAQFGFDVAEPFLRVDQGDDASSQLAKFHESLALSRDSLDYEIDGVVYKVDSAEARIASGSTAKAPRWAIAHKFDGDAAVAATKLLEVRVSVGKRGTMTPVAVLEPVGLGDVEVKSATLHNAQLLRTTLKGITLGGTVFVKRAGDVIPQIVPAPPDHGETADEREGDFDDWSPPSECPSCGTTTVEGADGELFCPNSFDCPAQAVERLAHFVSRNGVDLGAGLGKKKIEQLVQANIIQTCADLLELDHGDDVVVESLTRLFGWGEKSAEKFLGAVERRRKRPVTLATFIFALGVPRIGQTKATVLAAEAGEWDTLWTALGAPDDDEEAAALREKWEGTAGIGKVAMEALRAFALDPKESQVAERAAECLRII